MEYYEVIRGAILIAFAMGSVVILYRWDDKIKRTEDLR